MQRDEGQQDCTLLGNGHHRDLFPTSVILCTVPRWKSKKSNKTLKVNWPWVEASVWVLASIRVVSFQGGTVLCPSFHCFACLPAGVLWAQPHCWFPSCKWYEETLCTCTWPGMLCCQGLGAAVFHCKRSLQASWKWGWQWDSGFH